MAAEWSLSAAQKGLLATAIFVGMFLGALFWGRISDKIGRKFGFIATIGIDSVFGLLSAFSPNFAVFLVLRMCTGFGVGGTLPVDYAVFAEYLPAKDRGKFHDYLLAALADDDPEIQDAAIRGRGFMGEDAASGEILLLAARMDPDADAERLEAAVTALASIGLSPSLRAGLSHPEPAGRRIAVTALARIGGEKVSELLIAAYPMADAGLRRDMVTALLEVAGPEAREFFLGLLDEAGDEAVLKAALFYLGRKTRVEEAGDRMFALLADPRDDVKEAALEACTALGGEALNNRFLELAADPDPVNRLMAVYALGRIRLPGNLARIGAALLDPVPDIRKIALEAAAEACDEGGKGLEMIVSRLEDEAPDVRRTVVELLGRCPLGRGVPYLQIGRASCRERV